MTAMSAISIGLRPARRAVAAMRSRTRATFSAIDIDSLNHRGHGVTQRCQVFFFYWESTRARAPAPQIPTPHISCYMIAVGGAGSLGSPAAVSGNPIIKTARRNITIIPPKR